MDAVNAVPIKLYCCLFFNIIIQKLLETFQVAKLFYLNTNWWSNTYCPASIHIFLNIPQRCINCVVE